jgi:AcrR family transcriptional regulator
MSRRLKLADLPASRPGSPGDRDLSPSERLVAVARDLFCREGIRATGIDRILAESGVSKMTLYSRFGSKEALVREVLLREGMAWREATFARIAAAADSPRGQLGAIVQALEPWFCGNRFYGCAFMNAVAEHTKGEPWLRAMAADHQGQVLTYLATLAEAAGSTDPRLLARQIMLLVDGAIAAYLVTGDPAVLQVAERNLQAILSDAFRQG